MQSAIAAYFVSFFSTIRSLPPNTLRSNRIVRVCDILSTMLLRPSSTIAPCLISQRLARTMVDIIKSSELLDPDLPRQMQSIMKVLEPLSRVAVNSHATLRPKVTYFMCL